MTDLTTFRTNLGALIGAAIDAATWTPALLDEALRNSLRVYTDQGPVSETSFVVAHSGCQQDLSSIAQLYSVVGLAWPWSANSDFERLAVRWRTIDQHTVYLLNGAQPLAGDLLRIRYRQRHTIQDLDGATATTIPPDHERTVLLAAAIWLVHLRLRQLAENPAIPKEAGPILTALRDEWQGELDERFYALAGLLPNPVWSTIGL
jgi:hypothetical protein